MPGLHQKNGKGKTFVADILKRNVSGPDKKSAQKENTQAIQKRKVIVIIKVTCTTQGVLC